MLDQHALVQVKPYLHSVAILENEIHIAQQFFIMKNVVKMNEFIFNELVQNV
jgi:hypothetical protein